MYREPYKPFEKNENFISVDHLLSNRYGDEKRKEKKSLSLRSPSKNLPGGSFSVGPSRSIPQPNLTAKCSLPTVAELDGNRRIVPSMVFSTASRFEPTVIGVPEPMTMSNPLKHRDALDIPGTQFALDNRFPQTIIPDAPGPDQYKITRLFDVDPVHQKLRLPKISKTIIQVDHGPHYCNGQRTVKSNSLEALGVFGYGCSFDEHVKYGFCLDRKCAQRASWEQVAILNGDIGRIAGDRETLLDKSGTLTPTEAPPEYTPLEVATYMDDLSAICRLVELGADMNRVCKATKGTCLHIAVCGRRLKLVKGMLEKAEELGLLVDQRNEAGYTVLQIAASRGYQSLVEVLCDAGADPRLKAPDGQDTVSIAKTHAIFQILLLSIERIKLLEELADIQQLRASGIAKNDTVWDEESYGDLPGELVESGVTGVAQDEVDSNENEPQRQNG